MDPSHGNDWQQFFDSYAKKYNDEVFTKGTTGEIAFLLEELALPTGAAILDVGCGTGRHSIGLARHGFAVTGVDLSQRMLAEARAAAARENLDITFQHANAQEIRYQAVFDAAICLCEGALCLLGAGDHPFARDQQILGNIGRALKPGGRFIVTVLNAFRRIRQLKHEDLLEGRFDPLTMIEYGKYSFDTPHGPKTVVTRERFYTPPEFAQMLSQAGFTVEHLWAGTAGNWKREPVDLDEWEFMVVARLNRG